MAQQDRLITIDEEMTKLGADIVGIQETKRVKTTIIIYAIELPKPK